ncbi:Heavy metal RND efflux outer membrane protein, CzcC family [Labilithrix luteola]|uniref:Heavy metal RND efflux outer membrane protein, CzcC family n=1 Tax=Labilithrix luteola TaxID=1391654 RepID=A0A0K1PQX1_9BACT|nr:TolC family protein [Labilithrix luteola]AKU95514.1 Heavy metal RND efflux outer membrane protein, CzcC family [Labilithrix luteola]
MLAPSRRPSRPRRTAAFAFIVVAASSSKAFAASPERSLGIGAPQAIGFDDAIERAISRYPSARAAEADVERARADFARARSQSMPALNGSLSHLGVDSVSLDGQATRIGLASNQAQLSLSVPLFDPRAWADWSEGKEKIEVADARLSNERRRVALAAGRAWTAVLAADHVLALHEEALRTAEAHRTFTVGRVSGGIGTELDVVRANKEVESVRGLVELATSDCVRAREILGVLTGVNGAVDVRADDTGEISADAKSSMSVGVASGARIDHRPDVVAARVAHESARNERKHSYTDYLPSMRLDADAFYQDEPTPILPVSGVGYIVKLTLSVPIYDGGLRPARSRARRADEAAASARLEEVTRSARAEARIDGDRLKHAELAWDDARKAATLARRTVDLTRQRYADGLGTDLDVIDALRESRNSDIAAAVAEQTVLVARLDWLAAEGVLPTLSRDAHGSRHESKGTY